LKEKRWLDFRLEQARKLIEEGKPGIALRILKNQLRFHQDNPQVQELIQKAEEEIKRKQDPLNNTLAKLKPDEKEELNHLQLYSPLEIPLSLKFPLSELSHCIQ